MSDYLVKLYDLPPLFQFMEKVNNNGITIRRPIGPEKYAVIGGVGPVEFYKKLCGATLIEGSSPGIYKGMQKAKNWQSSKEPK